MKILIVDDEKSLRFALSELFKNEGITVFEAGSGEEAVKFLENESIDAAVVDYNLPGINGLDLLSLIKTNYSWISVILITAFGSETVAVEAIRKGAYDYIAKPFNNMELLNRINHIRDNLRSRVMEMDSHHGYYFSSTMQNLLDKIKMVSRTAIPVLITGESGTGKELIARLCHYHSLRSGKFLSVNCSAFPANLIESELFGAEKGSYTGADKRKTGLFELSDQGSLFLDEIGEMPYDMQAKLLRVLQEGEITRIGSGVPVKVDTRVIAATNRNIEDEVKNGKFREDLFYRLNVVHLEVPPLRYRKEEIRPLSERFLNDFNRKYQKEIQGFKEESIRLIAEYSWPGNIRELKNKIEQAVVFTSGSWIEPGVLNLPGGPDIAVNQPEIPKKQSEPLKAIDADSDALSNGLESIAFSELPENITEAKKIVTDLFEKKFIIYHLNQNQWNVTRASEKLGLHRQDLYKKMKKLGIQKEVKYSF